MSNTTIVKRQKIWEACLEAGMAERVNHNIMFLKGSNFKIRLNFRDDKILKLESKQSLTAEEKETQPNKNSKWVVDVTQVYGKVSVKDGVVDLGEAEKQEGGK